jgi:hypothetical protein
MKFLKHDAKLAQPSRHPSNSKAGRRIAAASSPIRKVIPFTAEQLAWNARVDAKKAAKKNPKPIDKIDPNAWAFENGLESF